MKRNALTDKQITAVKPTTLGSNGKPITQLTDGMGLYLKLQWADDGKAAGKGHQWRFDYTRPTTGKRNTMSLGAYPTVSLAMAREDADKNRKLIAQGVDPCAVQEAVKLAQQAAEARVIASAERLAKGFAPAGTLKGVCQDYHELHAGNGNWGSKYADQWIAIMTRKVFDAFPATSAEHIKDVDADDVLAIIRAMEQVGQVTSSRVVRKFLGNVFEYAERRGLRTGNPAAVIRKDTVRKYRAKSNPAATTPDELATVLRAIATWPTLETRVALKAQVMVFQRPGNTCSMRWAHLDLDAGLWTIPAEEMKMDTGEDHVVPLPRQLVAELREMRKLTGHTEWVFYSNQNTGKQITTNTLSKALRKMGFTGSQNAHGFRATARTMLDEVLDVSHKTIEAQLAHAAGIEQPEGGIRRDPLGKAYNRATRLDARKLMVQRWADYLDQLVAGPTEVEPAPLVEQPMPMLEAA